MRWDAVVKEGTPECVGVVAFAFTGSGAAASKCIPRRATAYVRRPGVCASAWSGCEPARLPPGFDFAASGASYPRFGECWDRQLFAQILSAPRRCCEYWQLQGGLRLGIQGVPSRSKHAVSEGQRLDHARKQQIKENARECRRRQNPARRERSTSARARKTRCLGRALNDADQQKCSLPVSCARGLDGHVPVRCTQQASC